MVNSKNVAFHFSLLISIFLFGQNNPKNISIDSFLFKEKSSDSLQFPPDSANKIQRFKISAYLEPYYSFDFAIPQNHMRQPFMFSHNRSNEINLNLALIQLAYENSIIRSKLGLMIGTYPTHNLAHEHGLMKSIYEATVGVKLAKKKNLWFDFGIMNSHIGFESAIGKDCWTLTRSFMAENSPYYEAGAKISYITDSKKWLFSALVLNGWQRIHRIPGNQTPAFGHQIKFTPTKRFSINSSSYIGNEYPDTSRRIRLFHHLHSKIQLSKKWGIIAGFDIGAEQKSKHSHRYAVWFTPIVVSQFKPNDKHAIAIRAEYFSDKNSVVIPVLSNYGFKTYGFSVNYDLSISSFLMWRIEARTLISREPIFTLNQQASHYNYFVTTSFVISL